jgi:hypothetical protein
LVLEANREMEILDVHHDWRFDARVAGKTRARDDRAHRGHEYRTCECDLFSVWKLHTQEIYFE